MPYTPQTWENGEDGGTPLSADRLNYMEAGIADAATFVTSRQFISRYADATSFPMLSMTNNTSYNMTTARLDGEVVVGSPDVDWEDANNRYVTNAAGLWVIKGYIEIDTGAVIVGMSAGTILITDGSGNTISNGPMYTQVPYSASSQTYSFEGTRYLPSGSRVFMTVANVDAGASVPLDYVDFSMEQII